MFLAGRRVSALVGLRGWRVPHYEVAFNPQPRVLRRSTSSYEQRCKLHYFTQLSGEQQQQINMYLDLVMEQNKVMNLTAIRDRGEAEQKHIEDSLALLPAFDEAVGQRRSEDVRVLDLGTGGGFPGVVWAVARYPIQVTLMDSVKKKCNFVRQATELAQIHNAEVVCARAETAAHLEHREAYDVVVARAVAELRVLVELCLPFVKLGGFLLAAKGPEPKEEVEAARRAVNILGGRMVRTDEVNSYGGLGQRTLVIIEKASHTPNVYPRRDGVPKSSPL